MPGEKLSIHSPRLQRQGGSIVTDAIPHPSTRIMSMTRRPTPENLPIGGTPNAPLIGQQLLEHHRACLSAGLNETRTITRAGYFYQTAKGKTIVQTKNYLKMLTAALDPTLQIKEPAARTSLASDGERLLRVLSVHKCMLPPRILQEATWEVGDRYKVEVQDAATIILTRVSNKDGELYQFVEAPEEDEPEEDEPEQIQPPEARLAKATGVAY